MKHHITLSLFLMVMSQQVLGVDCSDVDITINSQSDIDNFQTLYGGGGTCDRVAGDLIVRNISNLTNLDGLKNIKLVGVNLEIEINDYG